MAKSATAPALYDTGSAMPLACGHESSQLVRGGGGLYWCSTCRESKESKYSRAARLRHRRAGWGGIFRWCHGHRDSAGWCRVQGDDCIYCERLERIRAWVEANA